MTENGGKWAYAGPEKRKKGTRETDNVHLLLCDVVYRGSQIVDILRSDTGHRNAPILRQVDMIVLG